MFGEHYFAARGRLASLMGGIGALASETGTELGAGASVAELADGHGPPFLLVVCGEMNVGKSALLNGLFGENLCPMAVGPETLRVKWYRHGEVARDESVIPMLDECYRPVEFLRDFQLIDTPGINSSAVGHQEITDRFLPVASMVMFVLPVANPWSAVAWNFMSAQPAGVLDRAVLVIQQCDKRSAADLAVILGHMRDLSRQRLGRELPTFAVSAKQGYEARRAEPVDGEKWAESGFEALARHVSEAVCGSLERRGMLERWRLQAATALRLVDDRLEQQSRLIRMQSEFLEEEERNIEGMRERFIARLPDHLAEVAEVFRSEAVWVARLLWRRLGAVRSVGRLFVGDATGHVVEAAFVERLQATVEAVAERDAGEVAAVCKRHWNELAERVREVMGVELGDSVYLESALADLRGRFVRRLGLAAREGIGSLKVRYQLGRDLARRNLSLKSFTFVTLLWLTLAGVAGAMGLRVVPEVLAGLAGLFALAGVVIAWLTRRVVVAGFRERLLDTCGGFATGLRTDYEEALRVVFQDYGDTLQAIRRHLVAARRTLEPRQKRWNELFLTLKEYEQDASDR